MIFNPTLNIEYLETIADIRFGLAIAATWLHKFYITGDGQVVDTLVMRRLCDAVAYICDSQQYSWPRWTFKINLKDFYIIILIAKSFHKNKNFMHYMHYHISDTAEFGRFGGVLAQVQIY